MKQFFNQVTDALSQLRPFMIAAACAIVLFANATPAIAFGGSDSSPDKGLEQLNGVQNKSEQAITENNKNDMSSMRQVSKNSREGLNGVQGAANKKDMTSPSSADGNTIEGNIEEALDEITN
ncbi:MAG: hypothetical protein AAFZ17_13540 [Cyanobacteria bacterium J06650_10]